MEEQRLGDWPEWPLEPLAVLRALEHYQVRYVVIGGLAAVMHGSPLPTYDIDITPERSKTNIRALLSALGELDGIALPPGDDDRAPADLLAAGEDLSFFTPSGYLDVVFAPAGARGYRDLASRAHRVELEEGVAPQVAALRDVIHSKQTLERTRDQGQMTALLTLLELSSATPVEPYTAERVAEFEHNAQLNTDELASAPQAWTQRPRRRGGAGAGPDVQVWPSSRR
jgi:hypothetical protein